MGGTNGSGGGGGGSGGSSSAPGGAGGAGGSSSSGCGTKCSDPEQYTKNLPLGGGLYPLGGGLYPKIDHSDYERGSDNA